MDADSLAENTPNAPEFICPIFLSKPKSSGFQRKKASLGVRSPWLRESGHHGLLHTPARAPTIYIISPTETRADA